MSGKEEFDIGREHPEYAAKREMWGRYSDLYAGGERMRTRAHHYLVPRQKEPRDVYAERLLRVFYQNYAGSIVDWYTATVFRREPSLMFGGKNDGAKKFYSEFVGDCDLRGTDLTEFLRERFVELLVYGRSHILVDFPRVTGPVGSRAEEDAGGLSRAYVVGYSPEELINWSRDEHGNYEWVVLRTTHLRKAKIEDSQWTRQTRWVYYDRREFRVYEENRADDGTGLGPEWNSKPGEKEMTASGTHGLAKQARVPLFDLTAPEGLWLMNRAALLQLEHFNKSNALSWALTMGLFAMPVIYSERDWNQIVGESYYIQLGPQDKFGWTEPQGTVYQLALDNLAQLREEMYRVCYVTQLGGAAGGHERQSAMSKQRDFAATQEVLRAYGDAVKDTAKRVLAAVEAAREDGIDISVTGMDEFDIGDFGAQISDAQQLLGLGMGSPTLKKQVFKKLAFQYLSDAPQEMKDAIAQEIENGS